MMKRIKFRWFPKKSKEPFGFEFTLFTLIKFLIVFLLLLDPMITALSIVFMNGAYYLQDYNDPYVLYVYDKCNSLKNDLSKIMCVRGATQGDFNYIDNSIINIPQRPRTTIIKGGICVDSARFYFSIFKKLGVKVKPVTFGWHITTIAYYGDSSSENKRIGYYIFDGDSMK